MSRVEPRRAAVDGPDVEIVGVTGVRAPRRARAKRRFVSGVAPFALAGIATVLGALRLDHDRGTTLPEPTGPFAVGHSTAVWSDPTHADSLAPLPGATRELFAWLWYPAAPERPPRPADDYLPAPWRTALERHMGRLLSGFLTRDLSRVHAHGVRDAKVSPRQQAYPVVLMRGGAATLTADYTILAEDLASHGYVVVGIDAPYRSVVAVFPDGRVVERAPENDVERVGGREQVRRAVTLARAWSADLGFALDQLARLNASDPSGRFVRRLDLRRVGVFGHSLGGATALQFCHDDARCTAGVDVDGLPLGSVIRDGLTRPFLFLLSDHGREPETETRPVTADIRAIYDRLPEDRRAWVVIRGANHFGFGDDGAMLKSPLVMRTLRALGIVRLDGRRQVAVAAHYIRTFFDVYLAGAPASELTSRPEYPEVVRVR